MATAKMKTTAQARRTFQEVAVFLCCLCVCVTFVKGNPEEPVTEFVTEFSANAYDSWAEEPTEASNMHPIVVMMPGSSRSPAPGHVRGPSMVTIPPGHVHHPPPTMIRPSQQRVMLKNVPPVPLMPLMPVTVKYNRRQQQQQESEYEYPTQIRAPTPMSFRLSLPKPPPVPPLPPLPPAPVSTTTLRLKLASMKTHTDDAHADDAEYTTPFPPYQQRRRRRRMRKKKAQAGFQPVVDINAYTPMPSHGDEDEGEGGAYESGRVRWRGPAPPPPGGAENYNRRWQKQQPQQQYEQYDYVDIEAGRPTQVTPAPSYYVNSNSAPVTTTATLKIVPSAKSRQQVRLDSSSKPALKQSVNLISDIINTELRNSHSIFRQQAEGSAGSGNGGGGANAKPRLPKVRAYPIGGNGHRNVILRSKTKKRTTPSRTTTIRTIRTSTSPSPSSKSLTARARKVDSRRETEDEIVNKLIENLAQSITTTADYAVEEVEEYESTTPPPRPRASNTSKPRPPLPLRITEVYRDPLLSRTVTTSPNVADFSDRGGGAGRETTMKTQLNILDDVRNSLRAAVDGDEGDSDGEGYVAGLMTTTTRPPAPSGNSNDNALVLDDGGDEGEGGTTPWIVFDTYLDKSGTGKNEYDTSTHRMPVTKKPTPKPIPKPKRTSKSGPGPTYQLPTSTDPITRVVPTRPKPKSNTKTNTKTKVRSSESADAPTTPCAESDSESNTEASTLPTGGGLEEESETTKPKSSSELSALLNFVGESTATTTTEAPDFATLLNGDKGKTKTEANLTVAQEAKRLLDETLQQQKIFESIMHTVDFTGVKDLNLDAVTKDSHDTLTDDDIKSIYQLIEVQDAGGAGGSVELVEVTPKPKPTAAAAGIGVGSSASTSTASGVPSVLFEPPVPFDANPTPPEPLGRPILRAAPPTSPSLQTMMNDLYSLFTDPSNEEKKKAGFNPNANRVRQAKANAQATATPAGSVTATGSLFQQMSQLLGLNDINTANPGTGGVGPGQYSSAYIHDPPPFSAVTSSTPSTTSSSSGGGGDPPLTIGGLNLGAIANFGSMLSSIMGGDGGNQEPTTPAPPLSTMFNNHWFGPPSTSTSTGLTGPGRPSHLQNGPGPGPGLSLSSILGGGGPGSGGGSILSSLLNFNNNNNYSPLLPQEQHQRHPSSQIQPHIPMPPLEPQAPFEYTGNLGGVDIGFGTPPAPAPPSFGYAPSGLGPGPLAPMRSRPRPRPQIPPQYTTVRTPGPYYWLDMNQFGIPGPAATSLNVRPKLGQREQFLKLRSIPQRK